MSLCLLLWLHAVVAAAIVTAPVGLDDRPGVVDVQVRSLAVFY